MELKLYIADNITQETSTTGGQRFTFTSQPSLTDVLSFSYFSYYPVISSTTGVSVDFSWFPIPSPYTNQQMAADVASYLSLDSNLNVVYEYYNDYFEVKPVNGSPLLAISSGTYSSATQSFVINDIVNYKRLDLYGDETINYTTKVADIEKLSNIFTDVTNQFTIPANDNNLEVFKQYLDLDISNNFNANIRVGALIEIDTYTFRFGKAQLEGGSIKNGRMEDLKITFYGSLVQLTEVFGDDNLSQLDYIKDDFGNLTKVYNNISKFDFQYTEANFLSLLKSDDFVDGLIMPLINLSDYEWNYGTGVNNDTSLDIKSNAGAINSKYLRPSLRVIEIIKAIEAKYNITFTRGFLGEAQFNNLFIWLNGTGENTRFQLDFNSNFTQVPGNIPDPRGYLTSVDINTNIITLETLPVVDKNDKIILNLYWPFGSGIDSVDGTDWTMTVSFIDRRPSRFGTVFYTETKTFNSSDVVFFQTNIFASALGIEVGSPLLFDIYVDVNKPIIWNEFRFNVQYSYLPPRDVFLYEDRSTNTLGLTNNYDIRTVMPNIKVIDFIQGLMKMFKLIIRPITTNIFELSTIDAYYASGDTLNITNDVDNSLIDLGRPEIYKTIDLLFEKTNNVLGKKFREINDPINDKIGYGDLISQYNQISDNTKLEVKLPFENMLFERLIDTSNSVTTNILIGESISVSDTGSVSKNNSKPILFYNNGIVNLNSSPVKVQFKSNSVIGLTYSHLIGNTNNELISQVTNSINWGSENDPWHYSRIDNSLFLNYWSNWINTIYDTRQKKVKISAYLSQRFINRLSLNDTLIISNNKFRINDFKVDLLSGKTDFNLFRDFTTLSLLDFPIETFNNNRFEPSSTYLVDWTTANNDGSYYVYGGYTTYSNWSSTNLTRIKRNGDIDKTFNIGTGINSYPYQFSSVKRDENELLLTGYFTQYNGATAGRIVKINYDGSINSSFNSGSGFNGGVNGTYLYNNNLYCVGAFSTYNGTTASSLEIINKDSGSKIGITSSTFNNTPLDIVVNDDSTMFVSGYFTTYGGVSRKHIVKINADGSINTDFDPSTSFTTLPSPGLPGLIGLLKADGYVIAYGYFSHFLGTTQSGITKLKPNGRIDDTFVNLGFNGSPQFGKWTDDGKIFLSGSFSTYGDIPSYKCILLNNDGTPYQTFGETYSNQFNVADRIYGLDDNKVLHYYGEEDNRFFIDKDVVRFNSGKTYYGLNINTKKTWTKSTLDLGFGTNWVEILTPNGEGSSEIVIRCLTNNGPARIMSLKLSIGDGTITQFITIKQSSKVSLI